LRIKEQETRLILQEHDDNNDDDDGGGGGYILREYIHNVVNQT
jgi:hypothetical protein